MKALLQILIFFSIVLNLSAQDKKIQTETNYFYNTTQVHAEREYYLKRRKQVYHGESKEYYKNGNLKSFKIYKNGNINGKWIEYYESGQINSECSILNEEYAGAYEKFYENGNSKVKGEYIDGELKITQYGFPDGKFAIKTHKIDSLPNYELYDKFGSRIYPIDTNLTPFDDSINTNCKFKISFQGPKTIEEEQLPGLVIVKLKIDSDGKLINIEKIAGFHEDAVKSVINTFQNHKCYFIRYRNGKAVEYEYLYVVNFELIY